MGQLFLIAARNLLTHRRRTFLLGGAIAGVTALLVLMVSLSNGARSTMIRSATTLMSGHLNVGGFYKVTAGASAPVVTDYPKIVDLLQKNIPEVDYIVERGRGWARLVSDTGSMQVGVGGIDIDRERGFQNAIQLRSGSLEGLKQPNTILIFDEQAKKLDVKVGDQLTLTGYSLRGAANTVDLRVVAIAKSVGLMSSFNTFVPADTLRTLYQFNPTATGAVLVYIKNIQDVNKVSEKVQTVLKDHGYQLLEHAAQPFFMKFETVNRQDWTGQKLDVTTWEDEVSFLSYFVSVIDFVAAALTIILLVVIAVGIMNTLWISIRERTREIGTLRAIGMQRGSVLEMFLLEGFTLSAASTAAGALVGALLVPLINSARVRVPEGMRLFVMSDTLSLKVSVGILIFALIVITFCTTLISLIPSYLAARLKPVTAMHHVG